MTFDETLLAYTAGLEAEIAILHQVEALAAEQREVWTRNELLPLGPLATRRAALMHDLAAVEARIAPLHDRLRTELERASSTPGYAAVEARRQEAQALIHRLMAEDRKFLTDLETSLVSRRREAHDLETGNATLAAYRRVVVPTVASAGIFDQRG
ncbi:MAG: hypothetical protein ABIT71_15945 [Vicinamibacteraceae bacterium]